MDKLRFGVLGTGIIIRDFHLPLLLNNPRVELVAAGNLHETSLEKLAARFHIPKTYTDFDQMSQDDEIDVVIVGLPNYLHAPVTTRMLRAGKHVLCEKPMAMTLEECRQMNEAADASKRKLMIAHMWRFDREVCWLRDVVRSGKLGTIFKIKTYAVWTGDGPPPGSWFVTPDYAGGGALADMGIHSIDMISFLLDDKIKATKVFARTGTFFKPIELEDTATVTIEYDNNMTAVIEAGWYHNHADGPEGSAQVFGTQGHARTFPSELVCQIAGTWGKYTPNMPPRKQHCDLPMYEKQLNYFIDCVLNDVNPIPDGRRGLQAMAVLEAAYRSAKTGEVALLK
jgi:predicted dehydrogenase